MKITGGGNPITFQCSLSNGILNVEEICRSHGHGPPATMREREFFFYSILSLRMKCGGLRGHESRGGQRYGRHRSFILSPSFCCTLSFLYPKVDSLRVRKTQDVSLIPPLLRSLSLSNFLFFLYPVVDSSPSRCNIRLIELTLSLDAIKAGRSSQRYLRNQRLSVIVPLCLACKAIPLFSSRLRVNDINIELILVIFHHDSVVSTTPPHSGLSLLFLTDHRSQPWTGHTQRIDCTLNV